ncbi:hypothetical protein LU290_08130 [Moraxella nasibovis]|uniref:hypothetical protein n=1 Tax=Moraxella nasibovis TaxID=2904120 RepID=UPI00240F8783|nr:hypothetical protein [Moraxella nasibovis]WFF38217.1 hypothetical protein LU290_08130 [Moraxella nasibovis]
MTFKRTLATALLAISLSTVPAMADDNIDDQLFSIPQALAKHANASAAYNIAVSHHNDEASVKTKAPPKNGLVKPVIWDIKKAVINIKS